MPNRRYWFVLLLWCLLIGGCTTNKAGDSVQGDSSSQQHSEDNGNQLQSGNERNMVVLFRILLELNRSESESVTRAQAERMITLVKDGISQGELTNNNYDRIVGLFNETQKNRYMQMIEHWNSHYRALQDDLKNDENRVKLSPDDEMRMEDELQKRRSSENMESTYERPDDMAQSYFFSEDNLEKQVVDMLQNKLK